LDLKNVGGLGYNYGITKEVKMSANIYSIESLLVGKYYRSGSTRGEIIHAEKDNRAVWYDGCESYLVEIRPEHGIKNIWRTLAVSLP
jgi:hypothetical protein